MMTKISQKVFRDLIWYVKEVTDSLSLTGQGEVCGLCGNFDGDGQNDFTTKGQMVVSSLLEFANSWKVSSNCPDVETIPDTCEARPNRHHWAKMMCSIITGETFRDCHKKVMTNLSLICIIKSQGQILDTFKKN